MNPIVNQHNTLRMGWIPYWNLWPFKSELNRSQYSRLEIKTGVPVQVNHWLQSGQVDLAPCSSICLVAHPDLEMALPMGVASDGPVHSVYLGFQKEHLPLLEALRERRQTIKQIFQIARQIHGSDFRSVAKYMVFESRKLKPLPLAMVPGLKFSPDSASSTNLAKILFNLWFGPDAYKLMVGRNLSELVYTRKPMELLIGDEALQRKSSFHTVLDLGSIWKEMTNLPFVYAVWQSKGTCINGWRRRILDLGKLAESRMRIEPLVYLQDGNPLDESGKQIRLGEYWRSLYYQLGPRELKGLLVFLSLARSLSIVPLHDRAVSKLLRWEALTAQGSLPTI